MANLQDKHHFGVFIGGKIRSGLEEIDRVLKYQYQQQHP
jgi:hypothetical protein